MGLGAPEIIIVLVIVLIVFGAGRLPEVGKALPRAFKDFRSGVAGELPDREPVETGTPTPDAPTSTQFKAAATAVRRPPAHRFRGLGMLLIGIALIIFYLDTQVFQLGFPLQAASGGFALVGAILFFI